MAHFAARADSDACFEDRGLVSGLWNGTRDGHPSHAVRPSLTFEV